MRAEYAVLSAWVGYRAEVSPGKYRGLSKSETKYMYDFVHCTSKKQGRVFEEM